MRRLVTGIILGIFTFATLTFSGMSFFQVHESQAIHDGTAASMTCAADASGTSSCDENVAGDFACIDHCLQTRDVASATLVPTILFAIALVLLACFISPSFGTYAIRFKQRWRNAIQKHILHHVLLTVILRN